MLIKIINGIYGHNVGGAIKPKSSIDPPFDVPEKEAERLIGMKIARAVNEAANVPSRAKSLDDEEPGGAHSEAMGGNGDLDDPGEDELPEYGEESTNAELQAIAKEWGVELPPHANKSQMLEALDEFFGDVPDVSAKEAE